MSSMLFDSVLNLQAEIFKDTFGFVAMPEPMASAAAEQNIPTFVNPRILDDNLVLVDSLAVSDPVSEVTTLERGEVGKVLITDRKAGKSVKTETDEIGLGIGKKRGGKSYEFELVVVYQDRKLKNSAILGQIVERSKNEVRVEYGGRARALAPWHRERNSTLRSGSSIGHKSVSAGTLGCFVEHRTSGRRGLLSNNHVLANVNNATIGDEIRQAGRSDGGTAVDRMASLAGFVPLLFAGASNTVDCAWAEHDNPSRQVNSRDRFDSAENLIGQLSGTNPQNVSPGDFVMKTGRTTGYTQGEVDIVNVNNLNVNMGGGVVARFDGQIQIKGLSKVPFSRGGDSGSLIVNTNSNPVALLFAGSSSGGFENTGFTWANPISLVLNQLNLAITN